MNDTPHLLSKETARTPPPLSGSDDIVEYLRDFAEIVEKSKGDAVVVMLSGDIFIEAAEEIERLTQERNRWRATASGLLEDISNAEDEIESLETQIRSLHLDLMVAYSEAANIYAIQDGEVDG